MSLYRSWVTAGCPWLSIDPPDPALEATFPSNIMGLLTWDSQLRDYMDVRQAATSFPRTGESVAHPILQNMIDNFEDQLIQRMAAILLERKRLARRISLLTEALVLSESIIDSCYN
jgi:hypothetical protein